jgi:L-threonylcarbamoyladenylate synthase
MRQPSVQELADAAQCLKDGGLVAFPTETVYGLGADASNPAAVRRVFAAKGRPADHPLIVHLPGAEHLDRWARDIPAAAWRLAERFWPGPLTLILRRAPGVSDEVTGGQDTVGLRVPDHPVALALLREFGGGVAAPSANRFGRVSPTTAEHVRQELDGRVDRILDGGPCRVGVESTILSLAGERPLLLRPGAIAQSVLEAVVGEAIATVQTGTVIRASGTLESHYAPDTRLELWPLDALEARIAALEGSGTRIAALLIGAAAEDRYPPDIRVVPMPEDAADYAHRLYATLRLLDGAGHDILLAQEPPEGEAWQAVRDRLRRASHVSNSSHYPQEKFSV